MQESGDSIVLGVDGDSDRVGEGCALEFGNFGCHCGREEVGVPVFGEDREKSVEDGSEVNV